MKVVGLKRVDPLIDGEDYVLSIEVDGKPYEKRFHVSHRTMTNDHRAYAVVKAMQELKRDAGLPGMVSNADVEELLKVRSEYGCA